MDLTALADEVGAQGPVGVVGAGTRGGARPGVRTVRAPSGIDWFQPDEMTVCCGAGTPVESLLAALGEHGQIVALPASGTVGGALSVGRGDVMRLGRGPVRDTLLQARYVSADGVVVTAGGPTVKNVTGFDLCRLLVGAGGALGVVGEVILRTRPKPSSSRWFRGACDPFQLLTVVHRPTAILWDGTTTWLCLEGDPRDTDEQIVGRGLDEVAGPPDLPTGGRASWPPGELAARLAGARSFVAEIGVGVVHLADPVAVEPPAPVVAALEARIKAALDPTDRFGPVRGR